MAERTHQRPLTPNHSPGPPRIYGRATAQWPAEMGTGDPSTVHVRPTLQLLRSPPSAHAEQQAVARHTVTPHGETWHTTHPTDD